MSVAKPVQDILAEASLTYVAHIESTTLARALLLGASIMAVLVHGLLHDDAGPLPQKLICAHL